MKIVFVVAFGFPFGSASSVRAQNLCKLMQKAGHSVHVIADYSDGTEKKEGLFCTYQTLFMKQLSFLKRRQAAKASVKALKEYCMENKVDAVLMNAKNDRFFQIAKFCKKNGYPLLIENCEWYDSSSYKLGKCDIRFLKNEMMLRHGFQKADGFISISRLLHDHNCSFGKISVRIPAILDVQTAPYALDIHNEKIRIVYTGNPGKGKEHLLPMIQALAENEDLRERIEFHIYGATAKEVYSNIGKGKHFLQTYDLPVLIHGKIPQQEIQTILTQADYLLFLRPDRKSSHAGFPTKLSESLASGTPVITNNTGDIGLYLKNKQNGFLLTSGKQEELVSVLENIISLTPTQSIDMRKCARKTAEQNFDFRVYTDTIQSLLEQIRNIRN
ncbi:MAG: glycosyltransferase family 4 protein [Clostridia bacterium]